MEKGEDEDLEIYVNSNSTENLDSENSESMEIIGGN